MIWWWLACAGGEVEDPGPSFAPTYGEWAMHLGKRWHGTCALSDMSTYLPDEQTVAIDEYRYGFSLRDAEGYWYPCTLDGTQFVCALPVVKDDLTGAGLDLVATYTPTYEGTFLDAGSLEGDYRMQADCVGEDCDLLTGFGPDYVAPCELTTPLDAALLGG